MRLTNALCVYQMLFASTECSSRLLITFTHTGRETKRAELFLKSRYPGQSVQSMDVDVVFREYHAHPAYMPCYVLEGRYLKDTLVTLVDGVSGKVVGERVYNHQRAAALATAGSLMMGLSVGVPVTAKALVGWSASWIAVPWLLSSALVKAWPGIRALLMEKRNNLMEMTESTAVGHHDPSNEHFWWADVKNVHGRYTSWMEREGKQMEADQWNEYHEYLRSMGAQPSTSQGHATQRQHSVGGVPRHPDTLGYYQSLELNGKEAMATQEVRTLAQSLGFVLVTLLR